MNTMRKDIEYTHDDLTSEELEAEVATLSPYLRPAEPKP